MYIFYIHYSGYCLFKVKEFEEIGHLIQSVRSSLNDNKKFSSIIKLKAFYPFKNDMEALTNITSIKNGQIPYAMLKFIEKFNFKINQNLGFEFLNLSVQFKEQFGLNLVKHVGVQEIIRSIKLHIVKILKGHRDLNHDKLFLKSLSHKILENNNVIPLSGINVTNTYNLIVDFEKNLNIKITKLKSIARQFFPELVNLMAFNDLKLLQFLSLYFKNETNDNLTDILEIEKVDIYKKIMDHSFGQAICSSDEQLIKEIIEDILKFIMDIRSCKNIAYNITKKVAPNLNSLMESSNHPTLIDSPINLDAARLIANAGSLKKLSELPSTTIHTLSFKDSLLKREDFRNSTRSDKDKVSSKQSKLLSNKVALACRFDYFSQKDKDECVQNYGKVLSNKVDIQLKNWSNTKMIELNEIDKDTIKIKIKKMKLKKKNKKKKWILKKKKKQSIFETMDVAMET